MCRERLFVGLRAIVSATCESLATTVGAPCVSRSVAAASGLSSHTVNVLRRSTLPEATTVRVAEDVGKSLIAAICCRSPSAIRVPVASA